MKVNLKWCTIPLCLLATCEAWCNVEQDFLAVVDSFYTAINAGDQAEHAALFTNDAWMLPNGGNISRGGALKASIRDRTGWVFQLKDIERLEYGVDGDLGYTINQYYYTYHQDGEPAAWHKTKNVHIWKRQGDGAWRLHVDIWNSTPE